MVVERKAGKVRWSEEGKEGQADGMREEWMDGGVKRGTTGGGGRNRQRAGWKDRCWDERRDGQRD
jgi:hypothetical protein